MPMLLATIIRNGSEVIICVHGTGDYWNKCRRFCFLENLIIYNLIYLRVFRFRYIRSILLKYRRKITVFVSNFACLKFINLFFETSPVVICMQRGHKLDVLFLNLPFNLPLNNVRFNIDNINYLFGLRLNSKNNISSG